MLIVVVQVTPNRLELHEAAKASWIQRVVNLAPHSGCAGMTYP
jgi:hypothetical protein